MVIMAGTIDRELDLECCSWYGPEPRRLSGHGDLWRTRQEECRGFLKSPYELSVIGLGQQEADWILDKPGKRRFRDVKRKAAEDCGGTQGAEQSLALVI